MPSRSSSAFVLGALLTAVGLMAAAIGDARNSTTEQTAGLIALTLGLSPILLISIRNSRALRDIDSYRAQQVSAGLRDVEAQRAAIQGEAFGLALELFRSGQLTAERTLLTPVDALADTGGRRYDL